MGSAGGRLAGALRGQASTSGCRQRGWRFGVPCGDLVLKIPTSTLPPPLCVESLFNVDAWNDVVAAARSIMYSINSPDSIFDVFWFSNEVERIGTTVSLGMPGARRPPLTPHPPTRPHTHHHRHHRPDPHHTPCCR